MVRGFIHKISIAFVILMVSLSSFAQQYHFVYIQADNQQPFYVKYGSKNYSSSSIGYLILPKLSNGDIAIQIGFPKNLYPEQTFTLSIANKDYGYALKNFDAKGWGLFNFQTTDIVMNANAAAASGQDAKPTVTTNTSNAFGNMLADAINDSTLNQQRISTDTSKAKVIKQNTITATKDTIAASVNNHSVADSNRLGSQAASQPYNTPATVDSLVKNYTKADSSIQNKTTADSTHGIVKTSENTSGNGTDLTFLDNTNKDTIHAFIPVTDTAKTMVRDTVSAETKAAAADSAKSRINNPFFNNTTNISTSQPAMIDSATMNKSNATPAQGNNTCPRTLSNSDADKLKKKIISLTSQVDILLAVHKSLRDKCISTEQVKDLGNLFLSDENRYGFYDAVYPFVYDYNNFPQLQNQLIDTYYKNRFKALLR